MRVISYWKPAALIGAALAALAANAAAASSDYYLKLSAVKGESAAKAGPAKQIQILSWSWGTTETRGWDGTIKGATSAGKFGTVGGAHRDDQLNPVANKGERAEQQGWVTVSKPLNRGAVRVKIKFPWLDCRVGAAFPDAVLQNDAGRYELKDAIITGCSPDEVSLNYAKVQVRGWDPAKKTE